VFQPVSAITGTVLFVAGLGSISAVGGRPPVLTDWLAPDGRIGHFWLVVVLLLLPALAFMVSKIGNALPAERRRIRVFMAGLIIGITPIALDLILSASVAPYRGYFSDPDHRRGLAYVHSLCVFLMAVATAYAVVVDRVLEVRFIVRRAIQYALARYTVLGILAVPIGLLALHLYRNRQQPLTEMLTSSSPSGWLLFTVAIALIGVRKPLLTGIDRRFFREQYDMRQILADLVEASRRAQSTRALTDLVVGEVDRALHVDRIAVLVKDIATETFRDPRGALSPLPCASSLAMLAGGAGSPLDVHLSSAGSPLQRLPGPEREWLADAGAQMLVPFLGSNDQLLGILMIGDKLSDAPFTAEDRLLLTAAVSSAALALEHRLRVESGDTTVVVVDEGERPGVQCVRCGYLDEHGAGSCTNCHGAMKPALLPVKLRGTFRVERQLGAGGMGVVYLAHDLTLDRRVALKTLPRVSPAETARLRREARSMASLQHPNLAMIYGSEVWRGLPVLVLEFLAGGTLADRLRHVRLPVRDVVTIGQALAGALAHLHRAGLLHGDVKPSNIGFTGDDVSKLLDFGLARLLTRMPEGSETVARTTTGMAVRLQGGARQSAVETLGRQLLGTPAYMSPEALGLADPNTSFDIWSLAVTLFEAATGRHPFAGADVYETIRRVTHDGAPDPCDVMPDCPPGLAQFFRLSLARRPEHRPASAEEFGAALRRLAGEA
jgi:hypothetical protein